MHILLVDDDETCRRTLGRMLSEQGYCLSTADGGREALERMEEAGPDLVLSDVQMPGMGGIEFLRQIRERYPHTPVVLMTAYGDARAMEAAFRYGVSGFLQKPVEVEALLAGIRRLEKGESR